MYAETARVVRYALFFALRVGQKGFAKIFLQTGDVPAIINMKNKNAAACECANTHKPAKVHNHLHNGPLAAPHGTLYDITPFFVKGGFCRFVFASVLHKNFCFLRCVGSDLHGVFVFHPASHRGRKPPEMLR